MKLQCYAVESNLTFYKNETNITKKPDTVSEASTSITSTHSTFFSKMQKITGSDNAFPPNIPLSRMISLNCAENTEVTCMKIECINEVNLKRFEQVSVIFSFEADIALVRK